MLIDTHAHLGGTDVDERLAVEMLGLGMPDVIVAASYDVESSLRSARIAGENAKIFSMVGVHPNDSQKLTGSPVEQLRAIAADKKNKVVAIGEIGLDYHYDGTQKEVQRKWMTEQMRLAAELSLPVSFHIRDAYEDALKIFEENADLLKNGAILHCYSGSAEYARQVSEKFDFYFSFSGVITFKSAKKYPDVLRAIPQDRLLAETDSPYMTPEPHRGESNVPANVKYVVRKMAEILSMDEQRMTDITGENARRLFKLEF